MILYFNMALDRCLTYRLISHLVVKIPHYSWKVTANDDNTYSYRHYKQLSWNIKYTYIWPNQALCKLSFFLSGTAGSDLREACDFSGRILSSFFWWRDDPAAEQFLASAQMVHIRVQGSCTEMPPPQPFRSIVWILFYVSSCSAIIN